MDPTCPVNQSQSTVTSSMSPFEAFGEMMVWIMLIYLVLLTLAIPPVFAFLGLVAVTFKRMWILLRKLIWKSLLAYITWVTTISAFLLFGPDLKYVVLLIFVVFWGIIPTTLLVLVVLTAPAGYFILHTYLYTGIMLCSAILLVDYTMMLWREKLNVLIALVMGVMISTWAWRQIWDWYCERGPGAAYLTEVEEQWEDEDRLWVILCEEFEDRVDDWLVDGREWWENVFWNHHVW